MLKRKDFVMLSYLIPLLIFAGAIFCLFQKKRGMTQAYTTALLLTSIACLALAVLAQKFLGIGFAGTLVFGAVSMVCALKEF